MRIAFYSILCILITSPVFAKTTYQLLPNGNLQETTTFDPVVREVDPATLKTEVDNELIRVGQIQQQADKAQADVEVAKEKSASIAAEKQKGLDLAVKSDVGVTP